MSHRRPFVCLCLATTCGFALSVHASDGPFDPPAGYYSNLTGTGAALKDQLSSAMAAGHIQRAYGEYRFAAVIIDADPNIAGNIFLVYDGASVRGLWDSGNTWNREHVWPQSRQPGDANNSTRGNLGDPHALKPSNPSINSSRGNKPFGNASTTGSFGSLGSYYFPGDTDKGDIARSLFYSDTRWGPSLGLSLVNNFPSGNQMGGLDAQIAWHYLDPPDAFEVRRNHAIFSQGLNPSFYTNNRNAFIDLPGTVWSVYVDQANNSTLFVGDSPDADGGSSVSVALNALVGGALGPVEVMITKDDNDGVYFSVTATPGLVSSIVGSHNAFPIGSDGDQRPLTIAAAPGATGSAGTLTGQVVIDNLDVTLQGGAGNGGNDADDVITIEITVYDGAVASFSPDTTIDEILLDLGIIQLGSGDAVAAFDFFNIAPASTGAPMDIDLVSAVGDSDALSTSFSPVVSLPAGASEMIIASLSDEAAGDFEAVFTFAVFNDRALFAQPGPAQELTLRVTGQVAGVACPADLAEPFGTLNFFDVLAFLTAFGQQDSLADFNGDQVINFNDAVLFLNQFNAGCP
jgi:endonuclease I